MAEILARATCTSIPRLLRLTGGRADVVMDFNRERERHAQGWVNISLVSLSLTSTKVKIRIRRMPFTRGTIVFKRYELEIDREFVGGLPKRFNGTTVASRQREIHFFYDRLSPADAILPYYSYSHRRYSPSIIYDVA